MTSINERFDRLDAYIAEGRVLRFRWSDIDADGRERVCLLVALAPEVGARGDVDACPASLIPPWLAKITPAVDDCGTDEVWPAMVRRYSRVVRMGATTLDDAGWRRVLARFLLAVLAEAALHDPSESCQRVSALWARVLTGDEPSKQEWSSSAQRAGRAASRAAWSAVSSAVWAADAASEASASDAAWAAAWAAEAAAAAAWDRMARALFDAIEAECAGSTGPCPRASVPVSALCWRSSGAASALSRWSLRLPATRLRAPPRSGPPTSPRAPAWSAGAPGTPSYVSPRRGSRELQDIHRHRAGRTDLLRGHSRG